MMILRRGDTLVLGLVPESIDAIRTGRLLRAERGDTKLDTTVFVLYGPSYEHLRAELLAQGYTINTYPPRDAPGILLRHYSIPAAACALGAIALAGFAAIGLFCCFFE